MYAWIWRRLPGPLPVRIVCAVALLFAVVAVCYLWVFPAVAPHMPFNQTTVGDQ